MHNKKVDCIFCNIDPNLFLFEDNFVFAINDIYPKEKTHILVITKTHFDNLLDINLDIKHIEHIFNAVRYIVNDIKLNHFKIIINNGIQADQVIFHLHTHIMSSN